MSQRGWQCVATCASSKKPLLCFVMIICRIQTRQYIHLQNIWLFCSIYIWYGAGWQLLRICLFVLSSTLLQTLCCISLYLCVNLFGWSTSISLYDIYSLLLWCIIHITSTNPYLHTKASKSSNTRTKNVIRYPFQTANTLKPANIFI